MVDFIWLFLFLSSTVKFCEVAGLSCYHCSISNEENRDRDLTCVAEPWNITGSVRTCMPHMKACKTVRVDYKESGKIQSFIRACSPSGENTDEEYGNFLTYTRYCFTNLCNDGDGICDDGEVSKRIVSILVPDNKNEGNFAAPTLYGIAVQIVLLVSYG